MNRLHRYDGVRHGGFYSQDDVRAVVAYAAERHITIVPEIDMPGHMQAAIAAYPELGNLAEPVEVARKWGISEHVLNVARADDPLHGGRARRSDGAVSGPATSISAATSA